MNQLLTATAPFAILTEAPVEMTYENCRQLEAQDKANGERVCRIAMGRFYGHTAESGVKITPGRSLLVVQGHTVPAKLFYTSGGYMVEHEQAYGRYVTTPYHASTGPLVALLTRLGLQPYSLTDTGQNGTYNGFTLLGLGADAATVQRVLRLMPYRYAHVH